ncbi:hypothetical protein GLOIN_2v1834517 [Rhizophagus irregularis DAOM 181602=DAOM 197198]|nr:hypothetical protein GLOIN_2v1834517 [Rhizophagus irregularis DAOM 181602=DAOM 197198]
MALVVDLNAGQLAALIGVINVLLPILISGIGVLAIFMSTSDKMTALEWTTLSKISQNIPLSYFGTGGQPALTGIRLWSLGSYKRNVLYLLIGICPILLYGASAIAPLGIHTCSVMSNTNTNSIDIIMLVLIHYLVKRLIIHFLRKNYHKLELVVYLSLNHVWE